MMLWSRNEIVKARIVANQARKNVLIEGIQNDVGLIMKKIVTIIAANGRRVNCSATWDETYLHNGCKGCNK